MFAFPDIEPEITVTDLPGEDFDVTCRDDQSGFVLLEPGAELEFAFYDYPKPQQRNGRLLFTGAHLLKVAGRIKIEGVEALEVDWWYADASSDYSNRSGTTYEAVDDEGHRIVAWIQRHDPEMWAYEKYDMSPLPARLSSGLALEGRERVAIGAQLTRENEMTFEVTGAARVCVGPKVYRCLRAYNAYWNSGSGDSLCEYYVSDAGRTIYLRRYDGPASRRYDDELKDKPTIDYRGVAWRHFYDCIPDHALIVGL